MSKKWYRNWFNSPYYHILYHQRNDAEAEFFINNLCACLKPTAKLFDIACGRGRHSVFSRYFNSEKEHIKALKSFNRSLKKNGLLILDYFNTGKIIRHLVNKEVKSVKGINFYIDKDSIAGNIVKTITFEHKNKSYGFREEVKAFSKTDFKYLFKAADFEIADVFSDYSLNRFDEVNSDRIIFICRKK